VLSEHPEDLRHVREGSSQLPPITKGLRQGLAFTQVMKHRSNFHKRCEGAMDIEPQVNREVDSVTSLWEVFECSECLLKTCPCLPMSRAR